MKSARDLWIEWEVDGASILVVDDEREYAELTALFLQRAGASEVMIANSSESARRLFEEFRPELALVDYHIPPETGIDVVAALREAQAFPEELSIVMQTGSRATSTRDEALAHLVTDFVIKESEPTEMLLRVGKALRMHRLVLRSLNENGRLEAAVAQRTRQLDRANRETFDCLARAAALRDEDTAEHTGRVGCLAQTIACRLGFDEASAQALGRAARLHDVGKIGIPDAILRKPGPLTPEERSLMETHTTLGAKLLEGGEDADFRLATKIALSHHEHWDGKGYPGGLAKEDIPLEGRIVAVADAFDAMTKDRPYRSAMTAERAYMILREGSGSQWDPAAVAALLAVQVPANRELQESAV